jgi:DNA ligase-1
VRQFASLYRCLDETTKTNRKIACLRDYFRNADAADAAWAIYFLSGRKPKRLLRSMNLRQWCAEVTKLPDWLFEECHANVGDLAETIALLLDESVETSETPLHVWVERLLTLPSLQPTEQRALIVDAWRSMDRTERLVWNKLLTASFASACRKH